MNSMAGFPGRVMVMYELEAFLVSAAEHGTVDGPHRAGATVLSQQVREHVARQRDIPVSALPFLTGDFRQPMFARLWNAHSGSESDYQGTATLTVLTTIFDNLDREKFLRTDRFLVASNILSEFLAECPADTLKTVEGMLLGLWSGCPDGERDNARQTGRGVASTVRFSLLQMLENSAVTDRTKIVIAEMSDLEQLDVSNLLRWRLPERAWEALWSNPQWFPHVIDHRACPTYLKELTEVTS